MIALLVFLLLQAGAVPNAGISGIVVDAGAPNLQPLYHARVELERGSGSPLVLRTNLDGRFAFQDLPAGKYQLTVTQDGFIRKTSIISVGSGQQRDDLRVALDNAPLVVGRIRNEHSVPVSNILVEAMKVVYGPRGDRAVVAVESALTDDRGEFHLYWVDPGDYYIRASSLPVKPGVAEAGNPPENPLGLRYPSTYYPGVRDPKDASKFRLRIGSRISLFDFTIKPANDVSIFGSLSMETRGLPVDGATITIRPAGEVASTQTQKVRLKSSGYGFSNIPPGTYVLTAEATVGGQPFAATRRVYVSAPAHRLDLNLRSGIVINGQIASESGAALDLRRARVVFQSIDPDLPSSEPTVVNANGQFAAAHVQPGDYAIEVSELPGDTYVKSAVSGNLDIHFGKPLRIDAISPEPVQVVVGLDGGSLTGLVLDATDHPFAEARVALVPDAARRLFPDQFRDAVSGDDGRFALHGIPPGEYKLFAWQGIEANAYMDPRFLEGYEALGMPLTIPPQGKGSVSVRVIPWD